jgi:hypothetical protein
MVGEIKKGRYVYYHCTGFKGRFSIEPRIVRELARRSVRWITGNASDASFLTISP